MSEVTQQLRASDFVIFTGIHKDGKRKGETYKFAKIDSRCPLMNNEKFITGLVDDGARVIECK